MGSSTKIYTDMSITPINDDYESAYRSTMLETYKHIFSGMDTLIDVMGRSIAMNRSLYNDGFLDATGYNPDENISYRVINFDAVLGWAQANVDANITNVANAETGPPTDMQFALNYLQSQYPSFDYYPRTLTDEFGKDYVVSGATGNGLSLISITLQRVREGTVDDYLSTNYNDEYTVDTYGTFVEDGLNGNYWDSVFVRTYVSVPADPLANPPVEEVISTELVPVQVPVEYRTLSMGHPLASVYAHVTINFGGTTTYEAYSDLFPDVLLWSIEITTEVVVGEYGRLIVAADYEVTFGALISPGEGENWDPYYVLPTLAEVEANEAVEQARLEVSRAVNAYVREYVTYFHFEYTLLDDTSGIYMQADTIPTGLTALQSAGAFPILPIKRAGSVIGTDANRRAVFSKIGMTGDEFEDSVAHPDVYSAYMVFGIHLGDISTYANQYVFEAIDNLASTVSWTEEEGPGKVSSYRATGMEVQFSGLDILTRLGDIESILVPGTIGAVGSYSGTNTSYNVTVVTYEDNGDSGVERIETIVNRPHYIKRKQVSDNFYQEIHIKEAYTDYSIDSNEMLNEEPLIPIVKDVMNTIPFREYMYLIIKSMQFIILTRQVVEVKWYQSLLFQGIMMFVGLVLTALSGGSAAAVAGKVFLAFTVAVASSQGLLSGELGAAISVAMIAYGGYSAITSNSANLGIRTLALASTTVNIIGLANQIQLYGIDGKSGKIGDIREESEHRGEELEESSRLASEVDDATRKGIMMPGITHKYADTYYDMALGDVGYNYDILYNYDTLYSQSTIPSLT